MFYKIFIIAIIIILNSCTFYYPYKGYEGEVLPDGDLAIIETIQNNDNIFNVKFPYVYEINSKKVAEVYSRSYTEIKVKPGKKKLKIGIFESLGSNTSGNYGSRVGGVSVGYSKKYKVSEFYFIEFIAEKGIHYHLIYSNEDEQVKIKLINTQTNENVVKEIKVIG